MTALLVGFGAGFMVSMQLGPLSLFLIRSTLRGTLAVGLAIGAGIATVDALYAAAGAAGAAPVLTIDSVRTVFGLVGAAVLLALGARTLWSAFRVRLGGEAESEVATPRRAFTTSLAATASNPLTIASWAAVFAAASTAGIASSTGSAVTFVAGVGSGQHGLGHAARVRRRGGSAARRAEAPEDARRRRRQRHRRLRRAARVADAARGLVIRVWLIPFSTNVERLSLALAHKGVEAEAIEVDPGDREEVVRVSGQELVPVADFDGEIVVDSSLILRKLEELHPDPPLWPPDRARRAELDVFIDWFNRVWKVAPNAIAEAIEGGHPDQFAIDAHAAEMGAALEGFESLLEARPYLFGNELSAADCVAFPFLKYAAVRDPADDELFHRILDDYQQLGDSHPNFAAWIERVNALPRALP